MQKALRNQIAYLASDHLDVYVATSMRLRHEFVTVRNTISSLSAHLLLAGLNLRWFDPTQAYCIDRVDKGLSEGLMLKRAKCTIYLAQESETLGKDSELASTLAQGKPVIALVPLGDKKYVDDLLDLLGDTYKNLDRKQIILDQLKVFDPSLAWGNNDESRRIRICINNPDLCDETELLERLYKKAQRYFNDRYKTLHDSHPLGLQVDLETGVATGVLVVRNIDQCAELVRSCVLKNITFDISTEKKENGEYIYLVERISKSIYRVVTGDKMLTNAFWNYYHDEPKETHNNFLPQYDVLIDDHN